MGAANRSMFLVTLPRVRSFFIWILLLFMTIESLLSAIKVYLSYRNCLL
jgi:hypothetical protein